MTSRDVLLEKTEDGHHRFVDAPDEAELAPPQRENYAILTLEARRKRVSGAIEGYKQDIAKAEAGIARCNAFISEAADEISEIDAALGRLKAAREEQGD